MSAPQRMVEDRDRERWTVEVVLRARRSPGPIPPGVDEPVCIGRFGSSFEAGNAAASWRSDPWFVFDAQPKRLTVRRRAFFWRGRWR